MCHSPISGFCGFICPRTHANLWRRVEESRRGDGGPERRRRVQGGRGAGGVGGRGNGAQERGVQSGEGARGGAHGSGSAGAQVTADPADAWRHRCRGTAGTNEGPGPQPSLLQVQRHLSAQGGVTGPTLVLHGCARREDGDVLQLGP